MLSMFRLVVLAWVLVLTSAHAQTPSWPGGSATGPAGGGLTGTYPNPTVATNANLTGPVTSVGNATAVSANAITNPILATMAANTVKCNPTAALANAQDCTNVVLAPPSSVTTAPAYSILYTNQANPITVSGAPAEFDHMRISQPAGGNNQYTITGTNSIVAGLNFQMESLAGSNASSNMYGVIGAVTNDGPGTIAGLYGRAIMQAGGTGTAIAIKSGVNCSSTAASCYGLQQSHDTFTSGGVVAASTWVTSNVVGQQVKVNYGLLLDNSVNVQLGGAAVHMFALGPGEFLNLVNAAGNTTLFNVTSTGNTGVGIAAGGFGLSENLSVNGFAVVGSSGAPQGIYGNTGSGRLVMGAFSNHAVDLRVNNLAVASFFSSGQAVSGTLTVGSATQVAGSAGNLGISKIVASGTAPGAGFMKLEVVAGTAAGTCKLQAYAGTSITATTIIDNIGAGC